MFQTAVQLGANGSARLQFATDAEPGAVIYVGLIPGTWDFMRQSRDGKVITLDFRGLKPGPATVSLMIEGSGNPSRFPVTFLA